MADADKIERAVKRLRMHEEGVKAAKAELASLLGLSKAPTPPKSVAESNGGGAPVASPGRPGIGEKGAAILASIVKRGGTARLREIIADVTGSEDPGEVEAKRIRSAIFHMKNGGLVESPARGTWTTTEAGANLRLSGEPGF